MTKKKNQGEAQGFRAVILAAGKGTRMKSALPKVLHMACGRTLLGHVFSACGEAGAKKLIPVLGHGGDEVRAVLDSYRSSLAIPIEDVEQRSLLGTGDAVRAALPALEGDNSLIMILNGDGPLVSASTLTSILEAHRKEKADLTIGVMTLENPFGYGRIVTKGKNVRKIVEEKEANAKEKKISLVNGGLYVVSHSFLTEFLKKLQPSRKTGEFYLTDLVALGANKRKKIRAFAVAAEELLGVNDREQLTQVNAILRQRLIRYWIREGVFVHDPNTTYIDATVKLTNGVVLEPGVHLYGDTQIEAGARIEAGSYLRDSTVGPNAVIKAYTHLEEATVGAEASIGPFARLRPGSVIGDRAKIGNFVEIKKARIGEESKVSHLSYIGDAEIGADVNIGCGFITCNYDGISKHKTEIGAKAFIGSDVQAIAPIQIGSGAYVASGTTLTKSVPAGALAIARQKQENKEGYAERLRSRMAAIAKSAGKKKES